MNETLKKWATRMRQLCYRWLTAHMARHLITMYLLLHKINLPQNVYIFYFLVNCCLFLVTPCIASCCSDNTAILRICMNIAVIIFMVNYIHVTMFFMLNILNFHVGKPLEHKPVPLQTGEEAEYMLALKQEFRGAMKTLPFYIRPAAPKKGHWFSTQQ